MFFFVCWLFSKSTFSKNSFTSSIKMFVESRSGPKLFDILSGGAWSGSKLFWKNFSKKLILKNISKRKKAWKNTQRAQACTVSLHFKLHSWFDIHCVNWTSQTSRSSVHKKEKQKFTPYQNDLITTFSLQNKCLYLYTQQKKKQIQYNW